MLQARVTGDMVVEFCDKVDYVVVFGKNDWVACVVVDLGSMETTSNTNKTAY